MKSLLTIIPIIALLTFVGCKKDDDAPKPETPNSTCPTGYTGINCATQITPSKIRVNKIVLTKFPQYDSGSNWDVFDVGDSRPDVYVRILLNSTTLLNTNYYQDANYYEDYTFNSSAKFPFDIVVPTSQFTIRAYDYDSGADDYMGGINFTPYSSLNGFPSVITLNSGSVGFKLYVSYVF